MCGRRPAPPSMASAAEHAMVGHATVGRPPPPDARAGPLPEERRDPRRAAPMEAAHTPRAAAPRPSAAGGPPEAALAPANSKNAAAAEAGAGLGAAGAAGAVAVASTTALDTAESAAVAGPAA